MRKYTLKHCTTALNEDHEGPTWSVDEVKERIRRWVCEHTPNQPLKISLSRKNVKAAKVIAFRVYCITCKRAECKWEARAVYTLATKNLHIVNMPRNKHGKFDRKYGQRKGALTVQQKAVVEEFINKHKQVRLQQLMNELSKRKHKVEEKSVAVYVRNHLNRQASTDEQRGKAADVSATPKHGPVWFSVHHREAAKHGGGPSTVRPGCHQSGHGQGPHCGFRFASIAVRPGRNTDPVNGQGSWPSSAPVGSSRSSSIVASASAV